MWVSSHIARSSAYMVSTTFPCTQLSVSWTMILNRSGAMTDPRGTSISICLEADMSFLDSNRLDNPGKHTVHDKILDKVIETCKGQNVKAK